MLFNKPLLTKIMIKEKDKNYIKEKLDKIKEENKIISSYNVLNKQFILKKEYNSIIPLHLYTCWHTKDLPPLMRSNYDYLVESNPKITFHLYDENDCLQFIQDNFEEEVVDAYDSLIPCAYKSDLWRYCILYINGGIYMDIKYKCVNNFKFIALTEEEHFVRDIQDCYMYNALIVTLPNNELMRKCIYQIVENVKNRFYGKNPLDPTGPGLLGSFFTREDRSNIDMYHDVSVIENKLNEYYIVKNNVIILCIYKDYRLEQAKVQKNKYYANLWDEKKIYY